MDDHVLRTAILDVMIVLDRPHLQETTTTAAKSANTTAHRVMKTVNRSMTTGTAMKRAVAVIGHGPLQQTHGTVAAVVTRTNTALHDRIATGVESIDAATALDLPAMRTSMMMTMCTSMAKRIPMVVLDADIEVARRIGIATGRVIDPVIKNVNEIAKIAKSESVITTTTVRRIVQETRTKSADAAATVMLKKRSATTTTTSTVLLVAAAKIGTGSDGTTTIVIEKRNLLLLKKRKTLLAR